MYLKAIKCSWSLWEIEIFCSRLFYSLPFRFPLWYFISSLAEPSKMLCEEIYLYTVKILFKNILQSISRYKRIGYTTEGFNAKTKAEIAFTSRTNLHRKCSDVTKPIHSLSVVVSHNRVKIVESATKWKLFFFLSAVSRKMACF